jgi:hypothetical protein
MLIGQPMEMCSPRYSFADGELSNWFSASRKRGSLRPKKSSVTVKVPHKTIPIPITTATRREKAAFDCGATDTARNNKTTRKQRSPTTPKAQANNSGPLTALSRSGGAQLTTIAQRDTKKTASITLRFKLNWHLARAYGLLSGLPVGDCFAESTACWRVAQVPYVLSGT